MGKANHKVVRDIIRKTVGSSLLSSLL